MLQHLLWRQEDTWINTVHCSFCSNSDLVVFSQIYTKMWCRRHPLSANIQKGVCKELVIMIALTCSVHTKLTCVFRFSSCCYQTGWVFYLTTIFQCMCCKKQPHKILNRDTFRKSKRYVKRYIMFSVIVFGTLRPQIPVAARSKAWPLACWDCGFEFHWGHGCLSVVSVVCWQVEVSASGWSLVQRSPTECSVSECDH
jgi:hypothetical protein